MKGDENVPEDEKTEGLVIGEPGGDEAPEVLGDVPELNQEFIEQLLQGGYEQPEQAEVTVTRYWLDGGSFRAIAVLEQEGDVALILSDGDNNIVLFDSVAGDADGLDLLADIVAFAQDSLAETTLVVA